jgi:hypothetical protein
MLNFAAYSMFYMGQEFSPQLIGLLFELQETFSWFSTGVRDAAPCCLGTKSYLIKILGSLASVEGRQQMGQAPAVGPQLNEPLNPYFFETVQSHSS